MRVVGTLCKGLTFLLSGVAAVSCGNSNAGQNMAGGVPEFAVETLEPVSVDLKTTIPATIRGLQDVEIRPRVSGFITKLCVDEGAVVKKGQPLFLIDKVVGNMPEVELMLADGSVYPQKGRIETLTGVIDTKTGSFTLRALFPNTDYVLRSGGTGNVLIPSQLDSALMVPQKATSEIQDKKFVYVLQPDSTVKNTPVEVFNLDDGKNYVVTSGLRAGDRIVVEGVATLKDGAKIKAITPAEAAARLNALSGAAGAAQQQARQ